MLVDAVVTMVLAGLALLVYVRWLRSRQAIHGETALMLGGLGAVQLVAALGAWFRISPAFIAPMTGGLLLAQPYLLLRLAAYFGRVPPWQDRVALVGLGGAWAVLIAFHGPVPAGYAAFLGGYFVVVEGFSAWIFYSEARKVRGVVRQRLTAVAIGTAFLALTVIVLALQVVLASPPADLRLFAAIFALGAGLHYLLGFTPPAWLRRRWLLPALYDFAQERVAGVDAQAAAKRLCEAAVRATGSIAAGLATPLSADTLALHWQVGEGADDAQPWEVDIHGPSAIAVAWSQGVAHCTRGGDAAEADQRMLRAMGAQTLLAVPLATGAGPLAVLAVAAARGGLFADDDVDLLRRMAGHTAVVMDNARLLDETRLQAAKLATLHRVAEAVIRPLDGAGMLQEILDAAMRVSGTDAGEILRIEDGMMVKAAGWPPSAAAIRWPVGTGLVGEALRLGHAVYSPDVLADTRFLRQEEAVREGYRSWLALPLLTSGEPVGVLSLISRQVRRFAPDELQLLTLIAAQVAVGLRNLNLYETARLQSKQLGALYASSIALTSEPSLSNLLQRIVQAARALVGARYAALAVLGEDRTVEHFVTAGLDPQDIARIGPPPRGHGLLGLVLEQGAPVRVEDITTHPRAVGTPPGHPAMKTFLGVPVTHEGVMTGSLYVTDKEGALPFGTQDEHSLTALAAQAAVAIENTRLLGQLRASESALRRANEELRTASAAKSQFLANMSHELRTPLNAVIGFAELMIDDPELALETRRHYLENVHDSGRHLLALINDILDLSKVEAGRMELDVEPFDIALTVAEVLDTIRPLADQARVALTCTADDVLAVRADRAKCKQILYNLLSNAVKFTPPGGSVRVQCRGSADKVLLTVADTGVGIPPDEQERVFDEFHQVRGSDVQGQGGTGLGLALARRFAQLHGGRLWVESEPGRGSRFHVELSRNAAPATDAVGEAASSPAPLVGVASGPLVLVVEDDGRAARLLTHVLHRGGYRAEIATDGRRALRLARDLKPAAITLDVILPGMDGWEVLRALKQDPSTRDIPVVVVTIVDDPDMAFALGASDFLAKPLDRGALLTVLERLTLTATATQRAVTALVVDDEPASREVMGAMLRPLGFEVLEASGGADGLERARTERPDFVLLDLTMPEMDGLEVLDALRADPALREMPVLIVTARDLTAQDKERLVRQAAEVLLKGRHGREELIAWLDRHVRRRAGPAHPPAS